MSQAGTFNTGGGPTPGVEVLFLTGDQGGPVGPDLLGNINVITDNAANNAGSTFLILGTPVNNTLTVNVTDVNRNTMVGELAGTLAMTGTDNVAFGWRALGGTTTSAQNTAIGASALRSQPTGGNNVAIGNGSMIAIGTAPFLPATFTNNVGVGAFSLGSGSWGINNVAVGTNALQPTIGNPSGDFNLALGFDAGVNYNTGVHNANILLNSQGIDTDNNTLRIGQSTGMATSNQALTRAFIHGINGVTTSNSLMVTIDSVTSQLGVLAIPGGGSVETLTGDIGPAATPTLGNINIIAGNSTNISGGSVYFESIGDEVILNVTDQALSNTFIGFTAGNITTTGANNTAFGINGLSSLTSGSNNTAIGNNALQNCQNGALNLAVGESAGLGLVDAQFNTFIGLSAGAGVVSSGSNTVVGYNAMASGDSAFNTFIGFGSGSGSTGGSNTAVGSQTLQNCTGANNIAIGINAAFSGLTGSDNILIGSAVGQALTSAIRNTLIGTGVGQAMIDGSFNAALGWNAMVNSVSDTRCVAIGESALQTMNGTTDQNTALGFGAGNGSATTTGSFNTFLGATTGGAYVGAESNNILIGSQVSGVAAESNVLRVGFGTGTSTGQLNAAFISGIFGITTGVSGIPVVVDNADQLGTIVSSKRFKHDIQDLPGSPLLELRPVSFKYNKDDRPGIGLIAEEVAEIIPYLVAHDDEGNPISVKYHELPVLLLAEIKKLRKELDELKSKLVN